MLQHNGVDQLPSGIFQGHSPGLYPELSLEQFDSQVDALFFPMDCEAPRETHFSGTLQGRRLGGVGLAAVKSTPLEVYRRRSHIGQVADAVYMVKVQVEGESLVRHCGREAHLRAGDFTLCTSAEPYRISFPGDYCQVVLAIPENVMAACVREPTRFLGLRMDARAGANGLFTQFLVSMSRQLDVMDPLLAQRLESSVMDLLATTLDHAGDMRRHELPDCGVRREYLHRIRAFIRRHLDDERLGPDWIAERHGISTRYLHMLFESESQSVSRHIQQLRLEACKAALADRALGHYSVAEIAYRFGFKDASHFSRVFKSGFGSTPARFRREQCSA